VTAVHTSAPRRTGGARLARLRALAATVPVRVALAAAALVGGPWIVGAYLAYLMHVMRLFGVELAPTR